MTNRRVHITSFNDLGKVYCERLPRFDSFFFCHIINSLERFILFKSRTVTVSEHSPKELSTLLIHLSKQKVRLPNHEFFRKKLLRIYEHKKFVGNKTTTKGLLKGAECTCGLLLGDRKTV